MKYIFGYQYDSYYFENYKKVLEFIPENKETICKQNFDRNNELIIAIQNFCGITECKKFIVSLSGGVDSMVLITILKFLII